MLKKLFEGRNKFITWFVLAIILIFAINFLHGIVVNTRLSMTSYVASGQYPVYPTINTNGLTPDTFKQVKRGEYIVKAGDCIACHTAPNDESRPYSGGLPFQTPFGVLYSPNITPDKATGIGNWSDADFIKAMHEGISPSGSYYYPAFPYIFFNKITDEDLLAVRAYLNLIPAVSKENKDAELIFPFNFRILQLGWRILFFYPERTGPYVPDTSQTDAWNTGKYIVQGAGHCAMCHTPSYYIINENVSLGAPIRKYDLTGAVVEGYLAPNITKSNLGAIPDNELMKVFTQYQLIGGSKLEGPMAEAVHDSLIHLSQQDLLGIIEYLKSVESTIPKQSDVSESATGASVYNNYCSGCHTSGVGGAPQVGNAKSWDTLAGSGIEKLYTVAINGGGNMPARGTCITCTNDEIRAAVDYMVAFSRSKAAETTPTPKPAPTSQEIYQRYCSSCHSNPANEAPQLDNKKAWDEISQSGYLAAYKKIMAGKDHPPNAGCAKCSDAEVLSALKYMMQRGTGKSNYMLW